MSNIKKDMPAFPRTYSHDGHNGMTLRDYYKSAALQGFCANTSVFAANGMNGWDLVNCTDEQLAGACGRLADALIAEGEVQP